MPRRKTIHRRVILIRYHDRAASAEETYHLGQDGRHVDPSLSIRASRSPFVRPVRPATVRPADDDSRIRSVEFKRDIPRFPLPTVSIDPPPASPDIPPFSSIWLNNPDFSGRRFAEDLSPGDGPSA
jgi:hypothetical protein